MKLFYRKYGQGKPLIILHGLFGMSDNWMTLARHFGSAGFEAYTVDARNHGQSPHSDEFSYELMVDDLLELMNDLELKSASLLGHSMGGKIAMLLALNHFEKVDSLIVADMSPRYYQPHHQYVFDSIHALGDMSIYKSRKEVESKFATLIPNESTRQFLLKSLYWKKTEQGEQLAWRFNIDAIEKNIEDLSLTSITSNSFTKPTLFIKGEKSSYITSEDEPEIKKLFPNVIFKTIKGAGHWVHADKPKEFYELVIGFLTGL
jgi:esterase